MKSIVILISGRGSNMRALVDADLPLRIAAIVSNNPQAEGLAFARAQGIPTAVVDHTLFTSRTLFDQELMRTIDAYTPDLVVLAGFMRIFSPDFVAHYAQRLINIHPSLLPAFPGLGTHQRALEMGVKIHGCTVHYVTADVDKGPIVAQAAVVVARDDTVQTLAARVLLQEHLLYPRVLGWFAEDKLQWRDGRVNLVGTESLKPAMHHPDLA